MASPESQWDRLPAELQHMVVAAAGPMAQWLVWRTVPAGASALPGADMQRMWADAIDLDWQGDLAALPLCDVDDAVLARVRSPEMLVRLAALRSVCDGWHLSIAKVALTNGWLDAFGHFAKIDQLTAIIETGSLGMLAQYAGELTETEEWMVKVLAGRAAEDGNVAMLQEIDDIVPGSWRLGRPHRDIEAATLAVIHGQAEAVDWLIEKRPEEFTGFVIKEAMDSGEVALLPHVIRSLPDIFQPRHIHKAIHGGFIDVLIAMIDVSADFFEAAHVDDAIEAGDHRVVALLAELDPDWIKEMHLCGNLDLVVWIAQAHPEACCQTAVDWAAAEGHLHVIKWLREHLGFECDPVAFIRAVEGGHVNVLSYMAEHFPHVIAQVNDNIAMKATHLGTLRLLHSLSKLVRPSVALFRCIDADTVDDVKWACESLGQRVTPAHFVAACRRNNAAMVKWMLTQPGVQFTPDAFKRAAAAHAVSVVKVAVAQNRDWLHAIEQFALKHSDFDWVEWICTHHPEHVIASPWPRRA